MLLFIVTIYNKLVRDLIPDIIKNNGKNETPLVRILDDAEFLKQLNIKLQEEVNEYLTDQSIDELADIMEVIRSIIQAKKISFRELEKVRINKKRSRGGFRKKLFLESVTKN